MTNKRISELPELAVKPDANDLLPIVDTDVGETKSIKPATLMGIVDYAMVTANDPVTSISPAELEALRDDSDADDMHYHGRYETRNASVMVESPTSTEDLPIFRAENAVTINKMVAILVGSDTPSVTYTIRHGPDRNAVGTEVVTGGNTVTSITTGDTVVVFDDATIPTGNFVWFETTAKSGTISSMGLDLYYTVD